MPLPFPNLDQYRSDVIRKQAEDYGKSELRAGAEQLVNNSPTAQQLGASADEVKRVALKGVDIPKNLESLQGIDFKDGEQVAEQVIANILKAHGMPSTIADVRKIAEKKAYELFEEGMGYLSTEITQALGQYGTSSFIDNLATQYSSYAGLVTTTAQALKDGKITQGEAMAIGSSALTTAATVVSSSALSIGLGAVGAIFAPVAIGVGFLEGAIAAQRERNEKIRALAAKIVGDEETKINDFLAKAEFEYRQANMQLWAHKDEAVEAIANQWEATENLIDGSRFGIRFFPGSVPPLRAGWYEDKYSQEIGWYMKKQLCQNPAGCPYFPHSTSHMPVAETTNLVREERDNGNKLAQSGMFDQELTVMNPYQHLSIGNGVYGAEYAFYWRAIRAFDAFVPHKKDGSNFWISPKNNSDRKRIESFRDYGLLAWDWLEARDRQKAYSICPSNSYCSDTTKRNLGLSTARSQYAYWISRGGLHKRNASALNMEREAAEYVKERFERLQEDNDSLYAIRTRIQGDLIQTGAAVAGEIAMYKRIGHLAREMGTERYQNQSTDIGSIKILDDGTRNQLLLLSEEQKRDRFINNGVLLAGAALAGTAWWLKKRKR